MAARRRSHISRREAREGWLFAAPWIAGFLLFTAGPMLASILLSFTRWDGITPIAQLQWVGADNYREIFAQDERFWKSLGNTFKYVIGAVPLGTVVALSVALLLNQNVRGIPLFRTMFYLPSVVSGVATAMLWMWLFNPSFGLVNWAIRSVSNTLTGVTGVSIRLPEPGWLTSEQWVIPAFVIMSVWGVGNAMLIYLAGLQGVPQHLYEAAEIDGASVASRFRHVTLPILSPTIFFNLVMAVIGTFQTFTSAYIMTQGGPNEASLYYVLYLYRKAFEQFQMGYASALAWILFVIILAFTLLVIKSSPLWVYYEGERG